MPEPDFPGRKEQGHSNNELDKSRTLHVRPKRCFVSELFNPTLVIIYLKCNIKYTFRGAAQLPPEKFVVPRPLICSKSLYFQTLFHGDSSESRSCQARVVDVRPWIFRVFITWLYDRAIYYVPEREEPRSIFAHWFADMSTFDSPDIYPCVSGGEACKSETDEEEEEDVEPFECNFEDPVTWPFTWLFEIYVFANRYSVRELRNDVIDVIRTQMIQVYPQNYTIPYPQDIDWVCGNFHCTDPLYRLLAHWFSSITLHSIGSTVEEQVGKLSALPSDFAIYCFISMKRKEAAQKCEICSSQHVSCRSTDHAKEDAADPESRDLCDYHDHDGDENERAICRWQRRQGSSERDEMNSLVKEPTSYCYASAYQLPRHKAPK